MVPFTLTLVHYEDGDIFGFVLALISLSPVFIVVSYVTAIILLRFPLHLIFMFVGQLINVVINLVMKRVFQQPRPMDKPHLVHFGVNGMPSNHSQFMFFIVAFIVGTHLAPIQQQVIPYARPLSCFVTVLSFGVGYSRVYLEYHTVDQVVVGGVAGFGFGFVWWLLFKTLRPLLIRHKNRFFKTD